MKIDLGVGNVYHISSSKQTAFHIQIQSGYNSVLLAVCSQFNAVPSLLSLWFVDSNSRQASGTMPNSLQAKFRAVDGKGDFYIYGTGISVSFRVISSSFSAGVEGFAIETISTSSIPSDATGLAFSTT